ncbi:MULTISPECIES: hypothetical protein [unclassified Vibrio]|nr:MULTISPECIES: hypothetical protein [unclassified Vibrio]
MKSTTKRTQRDYSLAFKLTVVDEVEKGSLTYKQAQDVRLHPKLIHFTP